MNGLACLRRCVLADGVTNLEKNPGFLYPQVLQSLSSPEPVPARIRRLAASGKMEIAKAFSHQELLNWSKTNHAKNQPLKTPVAPSPHRPSSAAKTSTWKRGKTSSFFASKSPGFFPKKGGAWLGGKNLPHFRFFFTQFFPRKLPRNVCGADTPVCRLDTLVETFRGSANLSSPQGVRSVGRRLFAAKILFEVWSFCISSQQRWCRLQSVKTCSCTAASKYFSRYVPTSPRRKALEALAARRLKTENRRAWPSPKCLLGHPFSSAGMAQRAKEVENRNLQARNPLFVPKSCALQAGVVSPWV